MVSASVLAGIGLLRNMAGAGISPFAKQMFVSEGFRYSGLILALLALIRVPNSIILASNGA